ncbi:MAG: hypothetical protein ACETWK_00880 [Candidatus Aminicenantaceae bacterium]
MFKRYQVLLSDWLGDYVKFLCEKYDISISEAIRVQLCISILAVIHVLYPEYKPGFTIKEIKELVKRIDKNEIKEEERHKILSKFYFEARKAFEFMLSKYKK